jgi:hypothetical protein
MAHISEPKSPRTNTTSSNRLEVRFYGLNVAAEGRLALLGLLLLIVGLLAGVALPIILNVSTPTHADWNTILIALGTLCLGFGSASVIYQYYRSRESTQLMAQFDSLRMRADTLYKEFNAYEKSQSR